MKRERCCVKELRFRVGVLNSHPIQYFAPLYRELEQTKDIHPIVYYCSRQGLDAYRDEGFGDARVQWDIPLLEGYESHFLPNLSHAERIGGFATLVNPQIVSRLRGDRLDALLVHGHAHATELMAIAAARLLGIPLFFRSDSSARTRRNALKERLRAPLVDSLYALFDGFLTIGTENERYYARHGVPPHKMFRAPMAVDDAWIKARLVPRAERGAFRRKNGLQPESCTILFASKMLARKRAGDLLEAYRRLREGHDSAQLILIGDGEQRSMLERTVDERHIPDVHLLGFRNQSELPAWFSAADVVVLPSEQEPWGLVVNEAMMAGTPVIATTEVGAAVDLIRPAETGFTYSAGDVGALADLLRLIVRDPDATRRMGAAAARQMERWNNASTIEGIRCALRKTSTPPKTEPRSSRAGSR